MGSPATDVPKSTPGHGGKRAGAGGRPIKREQNDAYTILAKAKAKRETYLAQIAELEYRQRTGELIPAEEVAAEWERLVMVAKGRLMALPARLAPTLVKLRDMRSVETTIRDEIVAVLRELAGDESSGT